MSTTETTGTIIALDAQITAKQLVICKRLRAGGDRNHPWYRNVMIRGEYLYGGRWDMYAQLAVYDDAPERDAVAIPYDTLTAACKAYKGTLCISGGVITRSDGASFAFDTGDDAESMMLRAEPLTSDDDHGVTIGADAFVYATGAVASHASADESRPILTTIYVAVTGGGIDFAATDSYRLAICEIPSADSTNHGEALSAIIPTKAMTVAASLAAKLHDSDAVVDIFREGGDWVTIGVGDSAIHARTIIGQYPNYRKLVPESCEGSVTFAAAPVIAALSTWGKDNSVGVFTPQAESCTLLLERRLAGDAASSWVFGSLHADSEQGAIARVDSTLDFPIGANGAYVKDAIASVGTSMARMDILGALRPIVFRSGDDDPYQVKVVVMPVRF